MTIECDCLDTLTELQNWMKGVESSLANKHLAFKDELQVEMDIAEGEVQAFCAQIEEGMEDLLKQCHFSGRRSSEMKVKLGMVCSKEDSFQYLKDQEGAVDITLQSKRKMISELRCEVYDFAIAWLQREMC